MPESVYPILAFGLTARDMVATIGAIWVIVVAIYIFSRPYTPPK